MFIKKPFNRLSLAAAASHKKEQQAVLVSINSNKMLRETDVSVQENTVTAYSPAVSQTVQAEVQEFSSSVSSSSSSTKDQRSTPPPSTRPSPKKRTKYTIHDFLADNESDILTFGELNNYIINGIDVVAEFKQFQRECIQYITDAT
jgi:hypothetical protein